MDSITHIVVGAAIGDTMLRKKIGRWGAVVGAFLNTFPDFDLLISGFTDPRKYIVFHRAHTHALFYQFFYCFALAGIFYWIFKKRKEIKFQYWLVVAFVNVWGHSLMDVCTNYGTRLFLPFSRELIAFNNMAIIDLVLTIPILLLLIVGLLFNSQSQLRHSFITVLLIYTMGYFSYSFYNKKKVNNVFNTSQIDNALSFEQYMSNPTILNNFLWYGIGVTHDSLYISEYSVLANLQELTWSAYPRNLDLVECSESKEDIKLLKWFSQGFYLAEQRNDTLDFYAVKFGRNIFDKQTAKESFVFAYNIYKNDQEWKLGMVQANESNMDFNKSFNDLVNKIRGN